MLAGLLLLLQGAKQGKESSKHSLQNYAWKKKPEAKQNKTQLSPCRVPFGLNVRKSESMEWNFLSYN